MSADVSFSGGESFASAEELENLYLLLENGQIPELQWKNPGRIEEELPSMETSSTDKATADSNEMQTTRPVKNDFDFSDDFGMQSNRNQKSNRTTPKSAKKKTANFADVLKRIGK